MKFIEIPLPAMVVNNSLKIMLVHAYVVLSFLVLPLWQVAVFINTLLDHVPRFVCHLFVSTLEHTNRYHAVWCDRSKIKWFLNGWRISVYFFPSLHSLIIFKVESRWTCNLVLVPQSDCEASVMNTKDFGRDFQNNETWAHWLICVIRVSTNSEWHYQTWSW